MVNKKRDARQDRDAGETESENFNPKSSMYTMIKLAFETFAPGGRLFIFLFPSEVDAIFTIAECLLSLKSIVIYKCSVEKGYGSAFIRSIFPSKHIYYSRLIGIRLLHYLKINRRAPSILNLIGSS